MAPRPDISYFAPRPGEEIGFDRPVVAGEAFASASRGGQQTGVATNIPSIASAAEQLGLQTPQTPRPGVGALLGSIPRPGVNTGPELSAAQQDFLAGKGTNLSSRALPTPMQQAEEERARRAATLQERKDFSLQRAGEPARVAGEAALKTEGARQEGRVALAQQKGQIKDALQDKTLSSREKIATLKDATTKAEGELDRAAKSGDVGAENEARKDIANLNNSSRIELLREEGKLDIAKETRQFVQQAKLQAQREGGDLTQSLLDIIADPFVDAGLRSQILAQGVDNLISQPKPVATETTAVEAPAVDATEGGTDVDGDGKLSQDEKKFDYLTGQLEQAVSPARKLQIQEAMKQLKARILGQ